MNALVHIFKNIVRNYNLVGGPNRGLTLDYNIFTGATDTLIYDLEITNLSTQEKVSLPCYILPEYSPETQILKTLELLDKFIQITSEF